MARKKKPALNQGKGTQSLHLSVPELHTLDTSTAAALETEHSASPQSTKAVTEELLPCSPECSVTLGEEDTVSQAHTTSVPLSPISEHAQPSSWSGLFANNRAASAGVPLHTTPIGESCTISAADTCTVADSWGPTLIGYVVGRFPGKKAILKCCHSWPAPCQFSIHASGWLLFRFTSSDDLDKVLAAGPYFIFNRPLLLKLLPPFFQFENGEIRHIPVWVRLPSLPFELWTAQCLSQILSHIGSPLRTDGLTADHARASFARALVEVNAAEDRIYEVSVTLPTGQSYLQRIEYEYTPHFCKHCQAIGHRTSSCKYGSQKPVDPSAKPADLAPPSSDLPGSADSSPPSAPPTPASPSAPPGSRSDPVLSGVSPGQPVLPVPVTPQASIPSSSGISLSGGHTGTSAPNTVAAIPAAADIAESPLPRSPHPGILGPPPPGSGPAIAMDSIVLSLPASSGQPTTKAKGKGKGKAKVSGRSAITHIGTSLKLGGPHPPIVR